MWIAIFSQTGREIRSIATNIGEWPDLIFTNNTNIDQWCNNIPPPRGLILTPTLLEQFLLLNKDNIRLVTLHGYLRILSKDVCEQLRVFNGHPGDIVKYPELKGKDPQEKVFSNLEKYDTIGSVIHKVTSEVDSGDIVTRISVKNKCKTRADVYNTLKCVSLDTWLKFLKGEL